MAEPLAPGAIIGILGGGQLGRMLSMAAARLGYHVHIFEPDAAPAAEVSASWTHAPYEDADALARFAAACDVVTYEFENVPAAALDALTGSVPVFPPRSALETSQDRLIEKSFLDDLGLATAPFAAVDDASDLAAALDRIGRPAILKTRRFGYDGKGQVRITDDEAGALEGLAGAPAILEGFVTFSAEISVIAARGQDGQVAAFDPGLNVHENGILATTTVPAPLPASILTDAVLIAGRILNALDYVGVIGVEMFVTPRGLVVNEFAPRVHNSGHWTEAACPIDQFEQHIRAITGLPLGDGGRHSAAVMENLIGDAVLRAPDLARDARTRLHLYGKSEIRAGRKMGHATRLID